MRVVTTRSFAVALGMLALGCVPDLPEGELVCATARDCPPDWFCHRNGRCSSEPEGDLSCERAPKVGRVLGVPEGASRSLDVLFVIDDSNMTAGIQSLLADQIPGWIDALVNGDADGDGSPELIPVESIHFGVITSSMGSEPYPVPTCLGLGDDGELLTSSVAPGCGVTYPAVLEYEGEGTVSAEEVATTLGCLMERAGSVGCGFEQPLEAMLKALTPSDSPIEFLAGTGHADGANAGFLREDSILAVVVLASENDCSAENREIYSIDSPVFTTDLNLRCFDYEEELFRIERYLDGLLALRPDPSQLVVSFVTGTPADAGSRFATGDDFDALLSDSRMTEVRDPSMPSWLTPICSTGDSEPIFPGRRFVELGRELQEAGAVVAIPSLCASLDGAFDGILDTLQSSLRPECLEASSVRRGECEVVQPLPPGERCADSDLELAWVRVDGREACRLPFLPTTSSEPTEGRGWYFDDFGDRSDQCASGQGLVFGFGLELDADTTIQCETPDEPALGAECSLGGGACSGIGLACDPASFTCQRQCRSDRQCGGGFICAGLSDSVIVGVCSNPSCM